MNKFGILTVISVVALGAAFSSTARSDQWDKMTKVTVNQPIEVPGAVLQPGTYTFRLLDFPSDRHVVQIMNDRQNHVITTVNAINAERLEPTGKSVFTFYETPAGQPPAVKIWYYPGDNFGQEFIYGKHRTTELSKASTQQTQVAQNTPPPPPEPQAAPAPAPEPQPEVAQNEPPAESPAPPAPTAESPAPSPAPATLPQTASNVPFLMLIGLLSLGASAGLSFAVKRIG